MNKRRINRRTFAATFVLGFLAGNVILLVAVMAKNLSNGMVRNTLNVMFGLMLLILVLYLLATWIVVTLNRLHDIGWPWFLVILFGFFTPFLIILALIPGQKYENQYGSIPPSSFGLRSAVLWW